MTPLDKLKQQLWALGLDVDISGDPVRGRVAMVYRVREIARRAPRNAGRTVEMILSDAVRAPGAVQPEGYDLDDMSDPTGVERAIRQAWEHVLIRDLTTEDLEPREHLRRWPSGHYLNQDVQMGWEAFRAGMRLGAEWARETDRRAR